MIVLNYLIFLVCITLGLEEGILFYNTKFNAEKGKDSKTSLSSRPQVINSPHPEASTAASFLHMPPEIFRIYRSTPGLTKAFPLVGAHLSFFSMLVCEDLAQVLNKKHQAAVESFIGTYLFIVSLVSVTHHHHCELINKRDPSADPPFNP